MTPTDQRIAATSAADLAQHVDQDETEEEHAGWEGGLLLFVCLDEELLATRSSLGICGTTALPVAAMPAVSVEALATTHHTLAAPITTTPTPIASRRVKRMRSIY